MRSPLLIGLATCLALAGCAQDASEPTASPDPEPPSIRAVSIPAGAESGRPRLSATPDGGALLSWSEPAGDQYVLRYAVWADTGWSAPQTADAGDNWFTNWADTPGVVALPNGQMVAHTLVRQPAGGYAYDVSARVSDGTAWSEPVTPHTDGMAAEHGFVSVVPVGGRAGLVWLDGREQAGGHGHGGGAMTLRFATLGPDGELADEAILDNKTCDCCPTTAVATSRGLVVAYRDRSDTEIRDISVVRQLDGVWTEPTTVHADGWEINACPVNGPALAAHGDLVALAWYTGADSARVQLALSMDGGATFGSPVQVSDGDAIGRVAITMVNELPTVSWLERVGDQASLRIRSVQHSGELSDVVEVSQVSAGRESGIPQIIAVDNSVLAVWTDPEAEVPLRSARVPPPPFSSQPRLDPRREDS